MNPSRRPAPSRVAKEALAWLRAGADADKAASYQRYFKEPVDYYGAENKQLKQYLQELITRVRETWTLADAVAFCRTMVKDKHMEPRGVGYQVVAHFVPSAGPELLPDIRGWLEKTCGNWGLVDNLAPSVLGPLLDRYPDLIPEVVEWTASPNLWLRRGAVVAFVPLVRRKKKYQAVAYRLARRLLDDEEDLMHKAVGWLLREAGKEDPARLEKFLLRHGTRIPRTTVRYAIEKFSKEDRKRLLAATR